MLQTRLKIHTQVLARSNWVVLKALLMVRLELQELTVFPLSCSSQGQRWIQNASLTTKFGFALLTQCWQKSSVVKKEDQL